MFYEDEPTVPQWSWFPEKEHAKQIHDEVPPSFEAPSLIICLYRPQRNRLIQTLKTNILQNMDHGMIYTIGRKILDWTIWAVILKFPSYTKASTAIYEILLFTNQTYILAIMGTHKKFRDNPLYSSP